MGPTTLNPILAYARLAWHNTHPCTTSYKISFFIARHHSLSMFILISLSSTELELLLMHYCWCFKRIGEFTHGNCTFSSDSILEYEQHKTHVGLIGSLFLMRHIYLSSTWQGCSQEWTTKSHVLH